LAINVDLVDKVDEEIRTPFGLLEKSSLKADVKFLSTKEKADNEFLNQITYLQSLTKLVSNFSRGNVHVTEKLVFLVHRGEETSNCSQRSRLVGWNQGLQICRSFRSH